MLAILEIGQAAFSAKPRRIVAAPVIKALVYPRRLLGIGAGRVDRRHHGAGRRVGRLPGVNGAGGKSGALDGRRQGLFRIRREPAQFQTMAGQVATVEMKSLTVLMKGILKFA